jgi:hypothetical protein
MVDVHRCEADHDDPVRQHHCHCVKQRRDCQEHGEDVVLGRFPSSVANVGPVEATWAGEIGYTRSHGLHRTARRRA